MAHDLRQSSQLEELLDVADGSDWLPLVLSDELAATAAADALGLGVRGGRTNFSGTLSSWSLG